mgnify:FL=1
MPKPTGGHGNKKSPTYGKIVNGPEYLTVFEGRTGKELDSKEYIPTRYPLDGWGGVGGNCGNDNTGGRSDRFTAGVAFLDGKNAFTCHGKRMVRTDGGGCMDFYKRGIETYMDF